MLGDSEATSEQSSLVCEGAGYDEVFPLGHGLEEGLSWSSERDLFAHSPVDGEENYEVEDREGDKDEYDE